MTLFNEIMFILMLMLATLVSCLFIYTEVIPYLEKLWAYIKGYYHIIYIIKANKHSDELLAQLYVIKKSLRKVIIDHLLFKNGTTENL